MSTTKWFPSSANWGQTYGSRAAVGYVILYPFQSTCFDANQNPYPYTYYLTATYIDSNQTSHSFTFNPAVNGGTGAAKTRCNVVTSGRSTAADGSGISMTLNGITPSATIILGDGQTITPIVTGSTGNIVSGKTYTRTDANGNRITFTTDSTGNYLNSVTDTLGTTVLTSTGVAPSPVSYSYTTPGGYQVAVTATYRNYTVQGNFACSGIADYPPTNTYLLDRITYPDQSFYQFGYEYSGVGANVTGRLSSVKLPTGGTISYNYVGGDTGRGVFCADGSTAGLDRTTPDGAWHYRRTLITPYSASITTTTDPQNNTSVISFSNNFQTQRQIYAGSPIGTPLETDTTCYNGNTSNCANSQNISTVLTELNVYRSFNGGAQSRVDTFYNALGLATEKDEYGFGASSPSRKALITYDNTIGNNVLDRPSVVKITDGGGTNVLSETDYTYDEDVATLQASGAASLFPPSCSAPSGKCRGNVTTIQEHVTPSSVLTSHFTHYDSGTVYRSTDVNGAITTNTYGACGGSFLTNVTMPLSLSKSYTWNCSGGVMTSSTDENGQTSYTNYTTDPYFWRPESAKDALGNVTNFSYPSLTQTESYLNFNGGASTVDTLTTLDTLGRSVISQKRQAPGSSNFDTSSSAYDSDGRVPSVSLPCVKPAGQPCPAAPATTTTYDALNRPLLIKDAGNGTTTYSYAGNDTLQIVGPEHPSSKQMEYDGLGRLTSVCEVTSGTGSGACGQTSPQTGYRTSYAYDPLGNLTGVTQNAQGSPQQTRSYAFDGLSRLTSESNPETGNTRYVHDVSSGTMCASWGYTTPYYGDLVEKDDANGNAACTQYDGLHRALATYFFGPNTTPSKHFVYDSDSVNGVTMSNAKGRMAGAFTCTAGASTCSGNVITDEYFNYSPRGELLETYQSTPHSGGYYHPTAAYWAKGTLNNLWMSGLPSISFTADGEGRTSGVGASSGQNPVLAASYNSSSQVTGVTFGSGDSDMLTFDPNTGRMTQYKFNVNGSSQTANLGWNANGTLSSLGITDPFNGANAQNCTYAYDDLSRLQSVNCPSAWAQTFNYDAFGNSSKSGSSSWMPNYNSKNQYQSIPGFPNPGPTYDANGDVLTDSFNTYTWDAEGHVTKIGAIGLTYDALGRVVEQNPSPGNYFQILYSPMGSKLAVMKGQVIQQAFVPLPGGTTAEYLSWGLSHYRHPDWLGSSRLESGTARNIIQDVAYGPFGEPYAQNAGGNGELSFTGQNKDTDWLNYDFMYREYDPRQSRWISPDPSGMDAADPGSPQSWNRYAYVSNDPLNATDPDGLVTTVYSTVTVNASFPDDVVVEGSPFWLNFNNALQQFQGGVRDLSTAVWHWLNRPRDPGCMAAATGAGATAGTALGTEVGSFGFVGGPTGLATTPAGAGTGFVIGGSAGWVIGMNHCMMGGGEGGGGGGSSGGSKVRFGNNANQEYHTFRHVEEAGISKQAAEDAIRSDLVGKEGSLSQGLTTGQVNVGGKTLQYNAFKLPDGTINVGRITVH